MVNFIIRRDRKKIFRFATLQSEAGQRMLEKWGLPKNDFDSFLLFDKGRLFQKSSAALRLYNKLPWYWKWTQFFWIFPKFIRDAVYGVIARNRYRWFGKKDECMIPSPDVKERFLEQQL